MRRLEHLSRVIRVEERIGPAQPVAELGERRAQTGGVRFQGGVRGDGRVRGLPAGDQRGSNSSSSRERWDSVLTRVSDRRDAAAR